MTAIVLNALTEADFIEHFQVKACALFNTLRFYQLVFTEEKTHALAQLFFNRIHRPHRRFTRRHIMAGGENTEVVDFVKHLAGERVKQLNALNFIVKQADAHRRFTVL